MSFKQIYVLHLLLWYFIHTSEAIEFCESFAANGFETDYGFGGSHGKGFPHKGFLVIDRTYWRLDVHVDKSEANLLHNDSVTTTGFGKEYRLAFNLDHHLLGLVDKNNSIALKVFTDGFVTDLSKRSDPFVFPKTSRPLHMFAINSTKTEDIIGIAVIEGTVDSTNITYSELSIVNYNKITKETPDPNRHPNRPFVEKLLTVLIKHQVIGIFGPYLRERHINGRRKREATNETLEDNPSSDWDFSDIVEELSSNSSTAETTTIPVDNPSSNATTITPTEETSQGTIGTLTEETNQATNGTDTEAGPETEFVNEYLILIKVNKSIIQYFFLNEIPLELKTLINCSKNEPEVDQVNSNNKWSPGMTIAYGFVTILISVSFSLFCVMGYKSYSNRIRGHWFETEESRFAYNPDENRVHFITDSDPRSSLMTRRRFEEAETYI